MSNELNIYNLSGGKSKENEYTINDKLIQLDDLKITTTKS